MNREKLIRKLALSEQIILALIREAQHLGAEEADIDGTRRKSKPIEDARRFLKSSALARMEAREVWDANRRG